MVCLVLVPNRRVLPGAAEADFARGSDSVNVNADDPAEVPSSDTSDSPLGGEAAVVLDDSNFSASGEVEGEPASELLLVRPNRSPFFAAGPPVVLDIRLTG